MHVLVDLNSLCLYRLQRAQLFIQVSCYLVNFQVTLAVLLFVHSAILLNQLFGDWFCWKFKVFCAVFTAKEKPNLVSSEISIKLQVIWDSFEKRKINPLKRKPFHVSIVQNQDPLFRRKYLNLLRAFLIIFIVDDCHVECIAFNNWDFVIFCLVFLFF